MIWDEIDELLIGVGISIGSASQALRCIQVYAVIDYVAAPVALTNATTGVEETNATIHGYLINNVSDVCTVRFEYGTTTAYGTNTSNETMTSNGTFNANITGLSPGTMYHYRTYVNDSLGNFSHGDDKYFTTVFTVFNNNVSS